MARFLAKPLVSVLGLSFFALSSFAYAEDNASQSSGDAQVAKIDAQIKAQENQIALLKKEMQSLKASQQATQTKVDATTARQNQVLAAGASPVVTAPYLGIPARWDASDLLINQPTFDEDIRLMKRDAAMDEAILKKGFTALPQNPLLELGGKVEAQAFDTKPFVGNSQNKIDVSGIELDFTAHVSDWVNGTAALVYDNSAPNASGSTNAQLITNSRVYVDHAFITIGNLTRLPFYGTIGQRTLPYGHYSSAMISDPYTKDIFRIKDRALLLGYYPVLGTTGPYANAFVFKGDTETSPGQSVINNYGADMGYLFKVGPVDSDLGISGIANIADSMGMQNNGIGDETQFRGFGFAPTSNPNATELIQRRVPGANVHTKFSMGDYTFIAEGNMATSSFSSQDLTFNGKGAKPAAVALEGDYSFNLGKYPSSIAVGYDHTWQALALSIPQTRYITTFSTSLFRSTIESLELKHEINYSNSDTAGGQLASVFIPGHSSNTLTAQIGYYF